MEDNAAEMEIVDIYEMRGHNDFGRGLFATCNIKNDELIFTENSLIFIDKKAVEERVQLLIDSGEDANTVFAMDKSDHAVTLMHQIKFREQAEDRLTITEALFDANEPAHADVEYVWCYNEQLQRCKQ